MIDGVDEGLRRQPSVWRFLASSALSTTGISLMLTVLFKQAFDITGDLTLEAWIHPVAGNGSFRGILSKYSVPNETAYMIYLMPTGEVSFYLGETGVFSTSNRTLTSSPVPMMRWTHVVATYDLSLIHI